MRYPVFFGRFFFPVLCLLGCGLAGCSSNMAYKRIAAKNPMAKNSAKVPTKMVDVWKTYTETSPDGVAMRGIGGRIHFYDNSSKKRSVKVDGDLTVFVFDGNEKDPAHAKPLRQYKFTAETLQDHYSFKKPLGHGYDFFMAFDEIGGEEKTLCVMTRFDDRLDGALVMTRPMNTILQGSKPASGPENQIQEFLADHNVLKAANERLALEAGVGTNDIRLVAFDRQSEKPQGREGRESERVVTTIALNDGMTRRLSQVGTNTEVPPVTHGGITPEVLRLDSHRNGASTPTAFDPPVSPPPAQAGNPSRDGKLDLPSYPDPPY